MSDPWSAIMPGGVSFTSHEEDEDEGDWGSFDDDAPTDQTTTAGDTVTVPSTDVDSPLTTDGTDGADSEGEVPAWGEWANDWDDTTPGEAASAPTLMPGQWGTPDPVPATPAPPVAPLPTMGEQAPPVPAVPSVSPIVHTPSPVTVPAPAPVTRPTVSPTGHPQVEDEQAPLPSSTVDERDTLPPALMPGQWGTPDPDPVTVPAPVAAPVLTPSPVTVPAPVAAPVLVPALPTGSTPAPTTPEVGPVVERVPAVEPAPVVTPTPAPVPVREGPAPLPPVYRPVGAGEQVNTLTGELIPLPVTDPVPARPPVAVSVEDLLNDETFDWDAQAAAEHASKVAAKAAKDKERTSRANRPVAVTDRDILILQFLARYRMATYPQIAAAFDTSYVALRRRMPRLAKEGLVVRKPIGKSTYSVWLPTDAGIKLANMDVSVPTLSWATVGHTLGLVDIGIRFEARHEVVVTEREIRAADTRDQPSDRMRAAMEVVGMDDMLDGSVARLYVVNFGDGDHQYPHIPDMVLARKPGADGAARSVAIELELNHKPSTQWRKIMKAYKNAPHIGQVIYFTHQSKIRTGILAAAKEEGASHMVTVRPFEPSEDSAVPLPGRG